MGIKWQSVWSGTLTLVSVHLFVFCYCVFGQSASRESLFFPQQLGTISADSFNTFLGAVIKPIDDQNKDGFYDFAAFDLQARCYYIYGGLTVPTSATNWIDSCNGYLNLIGDLSGDGIQDVAISGRNSSKWKKNIYFSGPQFDSTRDRLFGNDFPFPSFEAVSVSKFESSSTSTIVTGAATGDRLFLFDPALQDSTPFRSIFPLNRVQFADYAAFGERIVVGRFNADTIDDIAVNYRTVPSTHIPGQVWIYFGGEAFDSIPDLIIPYPGQPYIDGSDFFGRVLVSPGDLNGDGFDDLFVNAAMSASARNSYVFLGGPALDSIPDVTFTRRMNNAAPACDVNHDGFKDLIASFFGPGGEVYIYLGGPSFDTIPDVSFFVNDWPGFYTNFGQGIAGIGDFNGDHIDDFAFSAEDGNDIGQIHIYSGWNSATGVDDEVLVPQSIALSQNYPNPFNPSTTIEFETSKSGPVELMIYDVLGRAVDTIFSGQLAAGAHSLNWDARGGSGNQFPSGVYFYRLRTSDVNLTKKMVLLR